MRSTSPSPTYAFAFAFAYLCLCLRLRLLIIENQNHIHVRDEFGAQPPFGSDTNWDITLEHVVRAIKLAPKTAPGPDGIPYLAWKRLGDFGADILFHAVGRLGEHDAHSALCGMAGASGEDDHDFNLGNMVFLPKKPAGTDPVLGDFYTAADVRPLVIVNTDNRLMANAVRIAMEPILAGWISSNQHGFIKDRSMLANVVDVTHMAQLVSLGHDQGGVMLFDFRAAFPSLSHAYLHAALRALGLPTHLLNFIQNLYDCHKCNIVVAGSGLHEGFGIQAGIRQGCPLSPLLFALVIDLLLRRMQRLHPEITIRAFADDIAVVAPDVLACLPCLTQVFAEAARVAGLHLNIPKCVLIPLWQVDGGLLNRDIARLFPQWASLKIDDKGTYLGFVIGPGAKTDSWSKPLRKYMDSAKLWGGKGMGAQYASLAYSTYTLPILSYIAQLCAPPETAFACEWQALKAIYPGPGHWCSCEDLHYMASNYGQARSLPSLSHTCMAAQKRICLWEDSANGGLALR